MAFDFHVHQESGQKLDFAWYWPTYRRVEWHINIYFYTRNVDTEAQRLNSVEKKNIEFSVDVLVDPQEPINFSWTIYRLNLTNDRKCSWHHHSTSTEKNGQIVVENLMTKYIFVFSLFSFDLVSSSSSLLFVCRWQETGESWAKKKANHDECVSCAVIWLTDWAVMYEDKRFAVTKANRPNEPVAIGNWIGV